MTYRIYNALLDEHIVLQNYIFLSIFSIEMTSRQYNNICMGGKKIQDLFFTSATYSNG